MVRLTIDESHMLQAITPNLPYFGNFKVSQIVWETANKKNSYEEDNIEFVPEGEDIKHCKRMSRFLIEHGFATHFSFITDPDILELTDLGREGQRRGVFEIMLIETIVEEGKKKRIQEIDNEIKKWSYKTRFITYVISGIALLLSIFTLIKKSKKEVIEVHVPSTTQQTK